ncbi:DNA integrity scanning protein DisA nucleotide-binding domain protein [Trichocoleus sp. FACHB-591]|uniref:diadenylate cyclase n=1 Tax=Trichocoleus sp. FACHB-591 TaxID=2692872 RepID=UPI0016830736|nr:diadenylate cyclase [Trichocoleus sp. FACHB-591]MBD2099173.1 DNA integrity scanning protein DisA nucleotide-binding domain protein [Trichocoleus sp. FACHB-591]
MKQIAPTYFMWPYQSHFRSQIESRAKKALVELGANIPVKALLVGVRLPEVSKDHPVCIEPEDEEWDISIFQGIHKRAGEIFTNHPDQHMFYGDEPRMRDKPENIRRKSVQEAIEEVLSRIDFDNETHSFCGVPVRLGNFHVAPILQVAQLDLDALPQLVKPIQFQGWSSSVGIVQALISHLLAEVSDELGTKEPGRFFNTFDSELSGLLRKAGQTLCNAIPLALKDFMLDEVFENLNKISELRYEGGETLGTIIFAPPDLPSLHYDAVFLQSIHLGSHRLVRKVVEISDNRLGCICQGSGGIVGFGSLTDSGDTPVFKAVFTGHYRWALYVNDTLLMNCAFGVPSVPQPRLTERAFFSNIRRVLPGLTPKQGEVLWDAVFAAMDQRHGTMLVVSDAASSEAQRLSSQAIAVEPIKLNSALVARISGIDGAILVDRDCNCHAIGVILDGIATGIGDPSRGARYNSALRYITSSQAPTVCLVVSEDGYVNMVPTLRPQIRKQEVEFHVELLRSLTADNYHKTLSWLEKHKFYLTSEQCEVTNAELSRIKAEPQDVGELRYIPRAFKPHPEMNASYYLDEV